VVNCVLAEIDTYFPVAKLIMNNMIKVREQIEKYGVGIIDSGRLADFDFSHRITITDTQFDFPESEPPNFDSDSQNPEDFDNQNLEIVWEKITD
jgi:hypothetical protein